MHGADIAPPTSTCTAAPVSCMKVTPELVALVAVPATALASWSSPVVPQLGQLVMLLPALPAAAAGMMSIAGPPPRVAGERSSGAGADQGACSAGAGRGSNIGRLHACRSSAMRQAACGLDTYTCTCCCRPARLTLTGTSNRWQRQMLRCRCHCCRPSTVPQLHQHCCSQACTAGTGLHRNLHHTLQHRDAGCCQQRAVEHAGAGLHTR